MGEFEGQIETTRSMIEGAIYNIAEQVRIQAKDIGTAEEALTAAKVLTELVIAHDLISDSEHQQETDDEG